MKYYKFSPFTIASGLGSIAIVGVCTYVGNWFAAIMGLACVSLVIRIAVYERLISLHETSKMIKDQLIKVLLKYTGQDN